MARGLTLLHAGLLAFAAPAGAAPPAGDPPSFTYEQARAMPPRTLARRLLGRERAAAVRSAVVRMSFFGGFDSITLMEPPARSGPLLCARRLHHVALAAVDPAAGRRRERARVRVESIETVRGLAAALASGECPEGHQSYYSTSPQNEARVAAVLGRLAEVRAAAAAAGPLPFRINCRPLGEDFRCAEGGRSALAGLRLDNLGIIYPVYTTTCDRSIFDYEGGPCPDYRSPPVVVVGWDAPGDPANLLGWEIMLPDSAIGRTWIIGLGAGGRAGTVEMEPHSIIFH